MKAFQIHDKETAPDASKPLLDNSIQAFGSIPNLHGVMAEAPTALKSYQVLHEEFLNTSFTAGEKTVVWQSINVEHGCHYCVPAHSAIAKSMKVDDEINEALRNKTPLPTDKLEVLRDTTLAIVRDRGVVSDEVLQRFYDAGYTQQNLLEIIVGVSQKVMSNYINHFADTPVDKQFEAYVR
ncbi:carboxymuconolactone decarboxylase family protein [Microbulbifer yueqingensis]|uniref:Alkylhydroperoxidase AhpD family core domain-containing protein n=1 Tax=Microbulbifer yueqingensis TaxID=658219 RepID=A0A1G9BKG9_9GAMM|nr:carboxymuconolactone decarboxylase family protein [Microbulbifer yueqingensis]SDK40019.1 alkylhydroperoxidase AhpD family core domain-containing protein [Microbulbifer yueqingensis]